ncbi:hypothetical protein NQ176_g3061 [Zarea fungicola]|uniref:Uncharacterized protein n=1 Tax=Zarea fungicola TaxID=93591 RepID=A0ACC1NKA0_9HYPO|nr:hypothetical protein NQ176_g3061 [Lecanicillium fungicola]
MRADDFLKSAENGQIVINCHQLLLRIAYIYVYDGSSNAGVFSSIDDLHKHGWSFGGGDLRFNRYEPLDTSARFYRLPDLQDLPDTTGDMGKPRQKGTGHFNKLPRWAHLVTKTHQRQPTLSVTDMTQIATSTLQQATLRLRQDNPQLHIEPYSATQALFWLKEMNMFSSRKSSFEWVWNPPHPFGASVALGEYDMWAWEAHYSSQLWVSSASEPSQLEPDLDGTRPSEVTGCGWPEGAGVVVEAWGSGWDPEVGSTEEIAFLTGVALKESEGLFDDGSITNYAMRSHILTEVLRAAFVADADRDESVKKLSNPVVNGGRLADDATATEWIRHALKIAEEYAHKSRGLRPENKEQWVELFQQMLNENGQLFGRWKPNKRHNESREFMFRLQPPQ